MKRLTLILAVALLGACPAAEAKLVQFQTPSGNIGCAVDGKLGARCDIGEKAWSPPPRPSSCELDWGYGVEVGRKGKGSYICAGDTALHQGRTLAYGKSIEAGRFRCKSTTSGVRCLNTGTGHGFKLSRAAVRLF